MLGLAAAGVLGADIAGDADDAGDADVAGVVDIAGGLDIVAIVLGAAGLGCDVAAAVIAGVPASMSGLPGLVTTGADCGGLGAGAGRGATAGGRVGSGDWLASSRSQAALVGAILSSAHASRWRMVATWLSQQATEQNTRRIRARLQVETLH